MSGVTITDRTTLLMLNDLQNPMGAESSAEEHAKLADLVRRHDLFVLCDEAYFDIRYAGTSRSLVAHTESTALACPSATWVQMSGARPARPAHALMTPVSGRSSSWPTVDDVSRLKTFSSRDVWRR